MKGTKAVAVSWFVFTVTIILGASLVHAFLVVLLKKLLNILVDRDDLMTPNLCTTGNML